ncbi:hypothetical protein M0R45_034905 [Rubus argutus]|uniref:Uncharacterized protein n=1 Tax=Rubus argutus TaxID=59490 RepID=A0AAW1VVP9_RUBAR
MACGEQRLSVAVKHGQNTERTARAGEEIDRTEHGLKADQCGLGSEQSRQELGGSSGFLATTPAEPGNTGGDGLFGDEMLTGIEDVGDYGWARRNSDSGGTIPSSGLEAQWCWVDCRFGDCVCRNKREIAKLLIELSGKLREDGAEIIVDRSREEEKDV